MQVLELKPLKNKKLNVVIVEKEYNEPFWMNEPPSSSKSRMLHSLFKPSIGFHKFFESAIATFSPDFATEEMGTRIENNFYQENILAEILKRNNIPFFPVDIDENAKNYLETNLDKKRELRDNVLKTIDFLSNQKEDNSLEKEYLIAYGQCLQKEIEEQEHEISFPIRESWIAMGILDRAKELDSNKEINCFHVCSPEHVKGIKQLLESLNANVEVVKLSKKIIAAQPENLPSENLENFLQSMQIQVKPVMQRTGGDAPYLLFYLDTDEKASPFDICMAYDSGYNAVIPYAKVTPEDAKKIVQDAVFSRGPKAVKRTTFFIGGKSDRKAKEVFKTAKDAMFPPFKASLIIDPCGAYTTAAAMVAKAEDAVVSHKLGELSEKTCAVLGTGSVGQIAAVHLAKLGCEVMIASLNPKRTNGKQYVEEIAGRLLEDYGVNVQGVFAPTNAEKVKILKKADVVLCAGTEGVQIIKKEMLTELRNIKVLLDVNAVPPLGIEGIKLNDNMREMEPGIYVIGAITVGGLKHKLEKEILRQARSSGDKTYDYNVALQLARKLIQKQIFKGKKAIVMSYASSKKNFKERS